MPINASSYYGWLKLEIAKAERELPSVKKRTARYIKLGYRKKMLEECLQEYLSRELPSMSELDLSAITLQTLKENGIHTISDLIQLSEAQLSAIDGIGEGTAQYISRFLRDRGY